VIDKNDVCARRAGPDEHPDDQRQVAPHRARVRRARRGDGHPLPRPLHRRRQPEPAPDHHQRPARRTVSIRHLTLIFLPPASCTLQTRHHQLVNILTAGQAQVGLVGLTTAKYRLIQRLSVSFEA
jgi:hypothetical protein